MKQRYHMWYMRHRIERIEARPPFVLANKHHNMYQLLDAQGIHITLISFNGDSKQRRQQARAILRELNQ